MKTLLRLFFFWPLLLAAQPTPPAVQTVMANTSTGVLVSPSNFFTGNVVLINPMTTLGDAIYGGASGAPTRLAGSTSATMAVLTQTGNGATSAAPIWTSTTGTGNVVRATSPTLVTPILGTPTSGTLTNTTGFPVANLAGAGTGVLTALAVNVGSAGAFVTFNGALGTPSSGVATNLTGLPLTSGVTGVLPVANGGTNASSASITAFNNITGYSAAGATGTTSTNLVFSTSPTITTPTITGGTHTAITGLGIRSTGAAFDLTVASSEVLTAGRTLSIVVGDAARTLTLFGSTTVPVASQQITLAGPTAARTWTAPDASFTIARTDAANTFTGTQTFSNAISYGGVTLSAAVTGTGNMALSITPTLTGSPVVGGVTFSSSAATALNSVTAAASTDLVLSSGTTSSVFTLVHGTNAGFTAQTAGAGAFTVNGVTGSSIQLNVLAIDNGQQAILKLGNGNQNWDIRNDGTNLAFRDETAGVYPLTIHAGALGVGFVQVSSTLDASGVAGALVNAGGFYNAKSAIIGTNLTVSGSILGSGGSAPTNTTSGSNIFTAGIATSGPLYTGGTITSTGATATLLLSATAGSNPLLNMLDADVTTGINNFGVTTNTVTQFAQYDSTQGGSNWFAMSNGAVPGAIIAATLGSTSPSASIPAILALPMKKSGSSFAALGSTDLAFQIATGAWTNTTVLVNIFGNGDTVLKSSTAASSTITGALTVAGGVGIAGALYATTTFELDGTANAQKSIFISHYGSVAGNYAYVKNTSSGFDFQAGSSDNIRLQAGGGSSTSVQIIPTTAASSTTTGALQVAGGGSVQGAWWVGGLGNIAGALTVGTNLTIGVEADPSYKLRMNGLAAVSAAGYTANAVSYGSQLFTGNTGNEGFQKSAIIGANGGTSIFAIKTNVLNTFGSIGVTGAATDAGGGQSAFGVYGYTLYNVADGSGSSNPTGGAFLAELSASTGGTNAFAGTLRGLYAKADSSGATASAGTIAGIYAIGTGRSGDTVYGGRFNASGGTTNIGLYVETGLTQLNASLTMSGTLTGASTFATAATFSSTLTATGLLTGTAGVTTGAGVTNAAGTWKLGALRTGVSLIPSATQVIQIDVGGTLYSLLVCTTNP